MLQNSYKPIPKFSIVIPVYNRASFVPRAILSCLAQTEQNFEIVVIDDSSTDGSREVVNHFDDPRLRLFTQPRNMGVGPARNRGAAEARADWIVFLDSDDELVPDALAIVNEKIAESEPDVAALWFRCRWDDGTITPSTIPKLGRMGFEDALRFFEACYGGSDELMNACRRSSFSDVKYPNNRGPEDLYFVNFCERFIVSIFPEVLRLYHQDAENRLVLHFRRFDRTRDRQSAVDRLATIEEVLAHHGEAVHRYAPNIYGNYVSNLLTLKLLLGERLGAIGLLRPAYSAGVGLLHIMAVTFLGCIHPSLLVAAQRSSLRERLSEFFARRFAS
jgi:glycosyltransferase involved in cell wall biosynthesis